MTRPDATTPDEQWPTQSASTDTMPIEPPPSGLAVTPNAAGGPTDWQARYEAEHKRSRIFMVATALLGAGLLASLIFAAAQAQTGPGATGGVGVPGGRSGQPFGGPGGGHGHHDFHEDGERGFDGQRFNGQQFGDGPSDSDQFGESGSGPVLSG